MRFIHKFTLLIVLSFVGSNAWQAKAFTPESGFWWNPNEPGSGYSIEIQDDYLFVALYVYDIFGNPTWYTASTYLSGNGGNSLFDANIDYTYNGPCIDCTYTQPITIIGDQGPITIDFITETTATLQFQGAVKSIERFNFLLGDELEKMRGEWQVIVDSSGFGFSGYPFFADVLIFDQVEFLDGLETATGCRSESTSFNICTNVANLSDVAAYYDDADGYLYAVVDHTDAEYLLYVVKTGLDQFDGDAYVYLKGNIPNTDIAGYRVRGFRSASRTFVETGQGPSSQDPNNKQASTRTQEISIPLSATLDGTNASKELAKKYGIIKNLERILELKKALKK